MFSLFWEQFKEFLSSAVPTAAQVALFYLIVRFAFAVASLLLDLAGSREPQSPSANAQPTAPQPQLAGRQARAGIPERASS